ncbi:response regulator [Vibrio parahaemolyticus]|nr:response regulator [Vibrio parahaemolyticus]
MTQDAPGRRILLVEDEGMIAMLVEDMLDDLGHELIRVATRLEDAVAAAGNEAIDLAILDLNLGGVLTYPAADVLAERGIPFIFATGYGSSGLKDGYTARPTLQKPLDTEALGQAIRQALRHRGWGLATCRKRLALPCAAWLDAGCHDPGRERLLATVVVGHGGTVSGPLRHDCRRAPVVKPKFLPTG